jgi:starch synthase
LLCFHLLQISGHPVIAPHLTKMFGIRNGIDQELWDPSIDEHLPLNYGPEDVVQGKAAAKRELRRRGNLADVDVPVVSGSQCLLLLPCHHLSSTLQLWTFETCSHASARRHLSCRKAQSTPLCIAV